MQPEQSKYLINIIQEQLLLDDYKKITFGKTS